MIKIQLKLVNKKTKNKEIKEYKRSSFKSHLDRNLFPHKLISLMTILFLTTLSLQILNPQQNKHQHERVKSNNDNQIYLIVENNTLNNTLYDFYNCKISWRNKTIR